MAWSSFTLLVAVCYGVYYGVNILFDMLKEPKAGIGDSTETLTIFENQQATVVGDLSVETENKPDTAAAGKTSEKIDNILKKEEQTEKEDYEEHETVVFTSVETIVQSPLSGGVSYSDLVRLCREKAIVESTKFEFT